ncbi:MAG: AI-2E family transporter [Candidatus Hydrogenedentes bacterium]|nr:AI-2E family transporter [Candidatus Hydrogenedentota bacterium]
MLEPVVNNPWVRALGVLLALLLVCVLLYLLSPVLVPLFFAFLAAYVLDPVVDFFEKRRVSRAVSIAGIAVLSIGFLLAIPLLMVPGIIAEADALIQSAQQGLQKTGGISGWLHGLVNRLPLRSIVESAGWVPEDDPNYDPLAVLTVHLAESVKEPAVNLLKTQAGQLASFGEGAGSSIAQLFSAIGRGLLASLLFLGNLALFTFVAAYLLKDFDAIVATTRDLVPPRYREFVVGITSKINDQLRGFLRGQMLVCLCLGTMYTVGLMLSGVPFALMIGVFGAIASFVPYLGLALTIGPALVLCILQHQGIDGHAAGVLATFVIAQVLEGTVLTPKIVGDKVGLGPVWVILAVLVFGSALGFLGLLLAVPIAAALKVLAVEGIAYYKASPLFQEE